MSARVLVVDDDVDIREAMQLVLEGAGIEILVAADGREAIHQLRTHPRPCLVLLDLMMPVMSGWQFLTEAGREGLLDGIPVVVISGGASPKQDARALGVAGYLRKPVGLDRLMAAVREHCGDV